MAIPVPTDDQLVDTLIDSYGHIWGCEPPMYDCSLEVVSKEVSADKALAVIEQTTINLDDAEDLLFTQDGNHLILWESPIKNSLQVYQIIFGQHQISDIQLVQSI